MSLDALIALMPPPANPVYAEGDWGTFQQQLGTRLPDEYKTMVSAYGVGLFACSIAFPSPFAPADKPYNLARRHKSTQETDKYQDEVNIGMSLPVFPERDGVLSFGWQEGINFFWRVNGPDPNRWTTCLYDLLKTKVEDYPMGAAELLERLLSKKIVSPLLHSYFPPDEATGRFRFLKIGEEAPPWPEDPDDFSDELFESEQSESD